MMPIRTYSLRLGAHNSDAYYEAIAALADGWFAQATHSLRSVSAGFQAQRVQRGERARSEAEYVFELLALGVLLQEHGAEAARWPKALVRLLARLIEIQEQWPRLENAIKVLRGWLSWAGRQVGGARNTESDVAGLIEWLRANGETSRAERLAQWRDYLSTLGREQADALTLSALTLAANFTQASQDALGQYTEGVEHFLAEEAPKHGRRYDANLLARTRPEYHLGMLGTEILSRAYREQFQAAKRKVVIVPPCMRAQAEEKCQAVATPLGAQCQHCTPTCRIHQVTQLGQKQGFEVYIIPDELRGVGAEAGRMVDGLGLVGVACALTNWSGGWEADALGVPAQGLLLDYVGCSYHWDEKGFPTDVNLKRLAKITSSN